jgi:hypothetical protein
MASSLIPSIAESQDRIEQIRSIYGTYRDLVRTVAPNPELVGAGLGGKLLYAGGIAAGGRNLLYAGNIAGVASLAASADVTVQRMAIRDGVVDFLVTSLEEALRILKNEIRKKQAVSVGVAIDPQTLVEQMLGRGVLPDLVPVAPGLDAFVAQGARMIAPAGGEAESYVTWHVDREFARWMPRLDSLVQAVVPAEDQLRQRWLKLAPRYLGRMAQKLHGVALGADETAEFRAAAAELIAESHSSGGPAIDITIITVENSLG